MSMTQFTLVARTHVLVRFRRISERPCWCHGAKTFVEPPLLLAIANPICCMTVVSDYTFVTIEVGKVIDFYVCPVSVTFDVRDCFYRPSIIFLMVSRFLHVIFLYFQIYLHVYIYSHLLYRKVFFTILLTILHIYVFQFTFECPTVEQNPSLRSSNMDDLFYPKF